MNPVSKVVYKVEVSRKSGAFLTIAKLWEKFPMARDNPKGQTHGAWVRVLQRKKTKDMQTAVLVVWGPRGKVAACFRLWEESCKCKVVATRLEELPDEGGVQGNLD